MDNRRILIALAIVVLPIADVLADVAPTEFIGSGIVPVEAAGIRMTRATVNIVWGTPCDLSATFELNNDSVSPTEIDIGFPMTGEYGKQQTSLDRFAIAFDGVAEKAGNIRRTTPEQPRLGEADVWYHCRHVFRPGRAVVTIEARLPASLTGNWPRREQLFYRIETGGKWAGPIGHEEVNIRFPGPVAREQIFDAAPANFEIHGDTISWRFQNIKPKGKELDIKLEYLRPDAFSVLRDLRKSWAANPDDPAATIKLAKHLFALGAAKGNAGYPPERLDQAEYDAILGKIRNQDDRTRFMKRYVRRAAGQYHEVSSEWTSDRQAMIPILNAADFQGRWSRSAQVDEARRLLEELLKKQPHNAEAWNVYLANFYRFAFGSVGPYAFGPTAYYPRQLEVIYRAHENCPKDPAINLWLERSARKATFSPYGKDALRALLEKNGVFATQYPKVEYGYY